MRHLSAFLITLLILLSATPSAQAAAPATAPVVTFKGCDNSGCGFEWTAPAGAAGYRIYRNGVLYASFGSRSWTDTAPLVNTWMVYVVKAINADGEGPGSEPMNVCSGSCSGDPSTGTGSAPGAPALVITSTTCRTVALDWGNVPDAGSYNVYRNGQFLATTAETNTAHSDSTVSPGVTYSYTVRAKNAYGEGPDSNAAAVAVPSCATTSPPAGVPVPTITAKDKTTVALTWSPVEGAAQYNLYRNGQLVGAFTGLGYTDVSRTPGTQYTYEVRAANGAGEGPGGYVSVTTDAAATPATAPTVTGATGGATTANLSWAPVSGATGYNIYRNGTYAGTTTGTSFTASGLQPSTTYTFEVRAKNADGEGPGGTTVVTTQPQQTEQPPPIGGPFTLVVNPVCGISYDLAWNGLFGVPRYVVTWDDDGDPVRDSVLYDGNGYSFSWRPPGYYSAARFTVKAFDGNGNLVGTASDWAEWCPQPPPDPPPPCTVPGTPQVGATAAGNGEISFAWTAVTGATSYEIGRRLATDSSYTVVSTTTTTQYAGSYPVDGEEYVFSVRAVNSCGPGPWSDPATTPPARACTTAPTVAPALTKKLIVGQTVTLEWSPVEGATSYVIGRRAEGESTYTQIGETTGTTWSGSFPGDGKTYYFSVAAKNECGVGPYADPPCLASCLCSLSDYIQAGAPLPQLPPGPVGTPFPQPPPLTDKLPAAPSRTGKPAPTVPTLVVPPDIPAPPGLPPIPEPPEGLFGLTPEQPSTTPAPVPSPAAPPNAAGAPSPSNPPGPATAGTPVTPKTPVSGPAAAAPPTPASGPAPAAVPTPKPVFTPVATPVPVAAPAPAGPVAPQVPLSPLVPVAPPNPVTLP